jgi:hypothetical protein
VLLAQVSVTVYRDSYASPLDKAVPASYDRIGAAAIAYDAIIPYVGRVDTMSQAS